jgi:diguanylate cyclase (GGDEF)-like protein
MTADEIETLKDLGSLVEDEIKVTAQVVVDELTQVANRRGFLMFADHTLSVCRRTDTPAELAFFDLDGFKAINDSYGHAAGDDLLKHFAQLLVRCFRDADAIGRLGGDEFVALLVGSSGDSDKALNRLRAMAADTDCEIRRKLDWSVGTACFDPDRHESVESLLVEADSAMYDHKVRRRAVNG